MPISSDEIKVKEPMPLSEFNRDRNNHQSGPRKPTWIPAEQTGIAVILQELLNEVKGLREDLRRQ